MSKTIKIKKNAKKNEKKQLEIWWCQRYFVSLHRQRERETETRRPRAGNGPFIDDKELFT